ncbi:MAG: hypothetical protein M3O22_07245, partial [Pseudomonadota bacterium]|nr:hypothetical protein [Pseudomonadota bacterium]
VDNDLRHIHVSLECQMDSADLEDRDVPYVPARITTTRAGGWLPGERPDSIFILNLDFLVRRHSEKDVRFSLCEFEGRNCSGVGDRILDALKSADLFVADLVLRKLGYRSARLEQVPGLLALEVATNPQELCQALSAWLLENTDRKQAEAETEAKAAAADRQLPAVTP